MTPIIEKFLAKRAVMDSAYTTLAPMTPAVREDMRKYFADFWPLLANPKRLVSDFKRVCRDRN
jgi:hypothetical protein